MSFKTRAYEFRVPNLKYGRHVKFKTNIYYYLGIRMPT